LIQSILAVQALLFHRNFALFSSITFFLSPPFPMLPEINGFNNIFLLSPFCPDRAVQATPSLRPKCPVHSAQAAARYRHSLIRRSTSRWVSGIASSIVSNRHIFYQIPSSPPCTFATWTKLQTPMSLPLRQYAAKQPLPIYPTPKQKHPTGLYQILSDVMGNDSKTNTIPSYRFIMQLSFCNGCILVQNGFGWVQKARWVQQSILSFALALFRTRINRISHTYICVSKK